MSFLFRFFFSSCYCAYRLSPVSADLVRFPKSSHISCRLGFVSFPSSRRFCANEQLPPVCFFFFATNAPRLLPFRSLIVLSIFCSTGFSRRFPRFHLCLFGLCSDCYESQSICFFFSFVRLCKFLWILSRPASFFSVLAFLLSLSFAVYLHDCLGFHCDFLFPTQTCTVFVCLSVLVVFVQDFGKTWQVCRSNSVPSTDLLSGFEIVEIFCQVLEGPPECLKNTMWRLSLSPRVQHVEAALAC